VKLCQSGKAHVCFVKTEKEGITVEKTQQSVGAYHIAL
jgi:recombinational DNA repair protein RecR